MCAYLIYLDRVLVALVPRRERDRVSATPALVFRVKSTATYCFVDLIINNVSINSILMREHLLLQRYFLGGGGGGTEKFVTWKVSGY